MSNRTLVLQRHRHLKWKALDPLEAGLMVLCGASIIGFTGSASRSAACALVNQRTSESSVWSGAPSSSSTSAMRPIIRDEGNGQGWVE